MLLGLFLAGGQPHAGAGVLHGASDILSMVAAGDPGPPRHEFAVQIRLQFEVVDRRVQIRPVNGEGLPVEIRTGVTEVVLEPDRQFVQPTVSVLSTAGLGVGTGI